MSLIDENLESQDPANPVHLVIDITNNRSKKDLVIQYYTSACANMCVKQRCTIAVEKREYNTGSIQFGQMEISKYRFRIGYQVLMGKHHAFFCARAPGGEDDNRYITWVDRDRKLKRPIR